MCGRFNLIISAKELAELFREMVAPEPELFPRYNIAPTQPVLGLRAQAGQYEWSFFRWGLVPSWSKDLKIGARLINARAETVREKPSFRAAFKRRRCLIPISGFYEWKREGKTRIPFHIHRSDEKPFAVAGLWETWDQGDGPIESCTILTTAANQFMAPIHDRMPVMLEPSLFPIWLDDAIPPEELEPMILPIEWNSFTMSAVSQFVNNARHEGPECLAPPPSEQGENLLW